MKLRASVLPPCQLLRGDLRRVPQNPLSGVVGYHICCPRCGFGTVAINGSKGLSIIEIQVDSEVLVTFSRPVRCTYCAVLIHLENGEGRLEEDAHVRQVRYR